MNNITLNSYITKNFFYYLEKEPEKINIHNFCGDATDLLEKYKGVKFTPAFQYKVYKSFEELNFDIKLNYDGLHIRLSNEQSVDGWKRFNGVQANFTYQSWSEIIVLIIEYLKENIEGEN